ncbi:hypothetical protein NGRA_0420, partial [Nosema granulosis]
MSFILGSFLEADKEIEDYIQSWTFFNKKSLDNEKNTKKSITNLQKNITEGAISTNEKDSEQTHNQIVETDNFLYNNNPFQTNTNYGYQCRYEAFRKEFDNNSTATSTYTSSCTSNNSNQSDNYGNLLILDDNTNNYKENISFTINNHNQSNEYGNLSILDNNTMTYTSSYTSNNHSNRYNNLPIVDNRINTSNNLDQSNEYSN